MLLPLVYFTDFNNNNNKRKERKKKDKRKRLNGWCPLGHNDNCGTILKCHHHYCKSLLMRPFSSDSGTSPAESSCLLTRSLSVAQLWHNADAGQMVFKIRGNDGIIKV